MKKTKSQKKREKIIKQKQRLKALESSENQFVIEAVTISIMGGIIGILLGHLGAYGLEAVIPALPVSVSLWTMLLGFFFSVSVGIFFGVYPAHKASNLNPIEALHYE